MFHFVMQVESMIKGQATLHRVEFHFVGGDSRGCSVMQVDRLTLNCTSRIHTYYKIS